MKINPKMLNENGYNDIFDNTQYLINLCIDFSSYYFKQKYTIITVILISIFTGIIIFLLPNTYIAETSFIAPPTDLLNSKAPELSFTPSMSISKNIDLIPGLKDPNDIFIEILSSRTINENIIKKLNLLQKFNQTDTNKILDLLEQIVKLDSEKGVITISVETQYPDLSISIANEYLNQLSIFLNQLNFKFTKNEKDFLEKRLQELKKQSNILNNNLARFEEKNNLVDLEEQSSSVINSIAELESELIYSEAELKGLEFTYSKNSPEIMKLQEKRKELEKNLNNIKNTNLNNKIGLGSIPKIRIEYLNLSRDTDIHNKIIELVSQQYELFKIRQEKNISSLKIIDYGSINSNTYNNKFINLILICIIVFIISLMFNFLKYHIKMSMHI